jgi:COP9 signalosome complex subunit 7
MSQEKAVEKVSLQFIIRAQTVEGLELAKIINQALNSGDIFVFAELLECPNVLALESTPYAPYLYALRLFSQGTYLDYLSAEKYLPELTMSQKKKLQHLTIVTLANKMKKIPYDVLFKELNVNHIRDLEDLIIEAIYCNLFTGVFDQKTGFLNVDWTVGRDVGSIDIDNMIDTLEQWADSCKTILQTVEVCIVNANQTKQNERKHQADVKNEVANIKKALRIQLQDEEMSVHTSGYSKITGKNIKYSGDKHSNK